MIQSMAKEQLERESSAYYCSSRVLDDGIIDPRDTRYHSFHPLLRSSSFGFMFRFIFSFVSLIDNKLTQQQDDRWYMFINCIF